MTHPNRGAQPDTGEALTVISQQLRTSTNEVRHTIRTRRDAGSLEIPAGARVSVSAVTGGINVTISHVDDIWTTIETTDPCGGPSRKVSPAAKEVAQQIIGIVNDHGFGYDCIVKVDDIIIGAHCR